MKNQHISVFVHFLSQLSNLLSKVGDHSMGDDSILLQRLHPDMFPFYTQVEIAAGFALRSSCPIAGSTVKSFAREEKSFEGLQSQLKETINYLKILDEEVNDLETVIEDMAGPVPIAMKAVEFLNHFAYPNFYFHLSMVYAIARSKGVSLTKGDYDGLHKYPLGFSFEK